jgi:YHS domain-containing protein
MKKLMVLTLLVLMAGASASLMAEPTTQPSNTPVNTMCPVMKDEKIKEGVTVEYKGKTIGFCCKRCVAKFNKDPEKYANDLK